MIVRRLLNIEREPYSREVPRAYAYAFRDHERALAFTPAATTEYDERFGMATGCRWASRRNDG